jgi:putative ABC transport system ATP-binding protein
VLDLRELSVTFNAGTPGAIYALRHLNLTVEEGSFVVIVGMNGSGKSSLLNALTGTVEIDEGVIRLAGHDITTWPEHRRARMIGRVGPNPGGGTAPSLTIADHLALAARRNRWHGLGRSMTARQRLELIERLRPLDVDFEDRLKVPAGTLPPVERQMLALLMAVWTHPPLLLLDDPTAALDPGNAERVIALTRKLVAAEHRTTLLVTQSMPQAINLGDRLVLLDKGQIAHDLRGPEKRRLHVDDLLALFAEIRCSDLLDESATRLLQRSYV